MAICTNLNVKGQVDAVYEEMRVAVYDLIQLCKDPTYSFPHNFSEQTRTVLVNAFLLHPNGAVSEDVKEFCLTHYSNKLPEMVILNDGTPALKECVVILGKKLEHLFFTKREFFDKVSKIAVEVFKGGGSTLEENYNLSESDLIFLKENYFIDEMGKMHELICVIIRNIFANNELKYPIKFQYFSQE